jgi:hypothetical protein
MTDPEKMELLEREPPLAVLASLAAEARRGQAVHLGQDRRPPRLGRAR